MIYAFTGKKQSGKSTACEYLQSTLDNPLRVNFKDGLYTHIRERYPDFIQSVCKLLEHLDSLYFGGPKWTLERLNKEKPEVWRTFVQNKGTNDARYDDPDVWVKKYWNTVVTEKRDIITDDVRFKNEADAVRSLGGKIIRIVRQDLVSTDTHISEVEMDEIIPDYTIQTRSGEFSALYKDIDAIVADILKHEKRNNK